LVIVTGAAGAGKSFYTYRRRGPDDLVLDLDELAHDLVLGLDPGTGPRPISEADKANLRDAKARYFVEALQHRNRLLYQLGDPACPWPRAWFIVSEPLPGRRQWWNSVLKPESIVVVSTPIDECLRRARNDPIRIAAARKYFALYHPRPTDVEISGLPNESDQQPGPEP
jgi:hypothetical protein